MKLFYSYVRASLIGIMITLMGYPVLNNGSINWKSVFILAAFITVFGITDSINKSE